MAEEEITESAEEFSTLIQKHMKTIAEGIKLSGSLPIGLARSNFLACFPRFKDEIQPHSEQLVNMISFFLKREGVKGNAKNCDSEEMLDLVVDGVNKILDRVRDNLNEMNGRKQNPISTSSPNFSEKNVSGSWNKDQSKLVTWKAKDEDNQFRLPIQRQKVLEKPQNKFKEKVDNSNAPFKPLLTTKPNAIRSLDVYLELGVNGTERYCHPYLTELNWFNLPVNQLEKVDPIIPADINTNNAVYVDNENALASMVENLKDQKELAVDLEHHTYRSYQGITCVMQISSRNADYIIDTLALRSKLHVLNEFFTDPKIVKVFHDANSDILWLQKDFGLYVVNLFDTHLAALALNFPRLGLAYLLKQYCNVECDKRYQLYDWRIRPLSEAALKYARNDTHYLLFVYDQLRNALIEKDSGTTALLESVYKRGIEICKKKHEKLTDENDYLILYKQSKQSFDNRQMYALKSLYQWRDKIARDEDESPGYVLPNHMLLHIAEVLPREMQGILACCSPVPVLVRKNLSHLHQLVTLARHQNIDKITIQNDAHASLKNISQALSKLRCPHDFSHHDDFRDNLTTLLDGTDVVNISKPITKSLLSVFDDYEEKLTNINSLEVKKKLTAVKFMSPYERYKRTIMYVISTMEKETNDNDKQLLQDSSTPQACEFVKRVKVDIHNVSESVSENSENVTLSNNEASNDVEKIKSSVKSGEAKSIETVVLQSDGLEERIVSKGGSKRKSQPDQPETVPVSKKKFGNEYDAVAETIKKTKVEMKTNDLTLDDEELSSKDESPIIDNKPRKKRKRKKNKNHDEPKKKTFAAFDYTKTNYNKFVTGGTKNLKKLLSPKIAFGANKNKKVRVIKN